MRHDSQTAKRLMLHASCMALTQARRHAHTRQSRGHDRVGRRRLCGGVVAAASHRCIPMRFACGAGHRQSFVRAP